VDLVGFGGGGVVRPVLPPAPGYRPHSVGILYVLAMSLARLCVLNHASCECTK